LTLAGIGCHEIHSKEVPCMSDPFRCPHMNNLLIPPISILGTARAQLFQARAKWGRTHIRPLPCFLHPLD
jgi:hypothetical protein